MIVANIFFGLNAPIAKHVLNSPQISALALTTMRMVGAAMLFWIASFFIRKEEVEHKDMLRLFFAALFGVICNQFLFIYGLNLTSPIDASIVCTTTPIITMIIAAIYLKEPITSKKAGGIFVGAMGALLLILSSKNLHSGGDSNIFGDFICLLSSFSYSIYLVVFKNLTQKYSAITLLKWMFLYASICYIPFSYHELNGIEWNAIDNNTLMGIGYVVIVATFLAYICIPIGQRLLRPTILSMYGYVQPIVSATLSVILGLDTFGYIKIIAIILVFLGVYLVNKSKSKAQLDAEKAEKNLSADY